MVKRNVTQQDIEVLQKGILSSHLLRMAGFADVVDRFIDIQFKDKVNWLKTFAIIILIMHGGTITPSVLGRRMLRSVDNMTKLVDALVQEGLVKRYRGSRDRRNVQIKVTPAGLSYMTNVLVAVEKEGKLVESSTNPSELEKFETLMLTLLQLLGDRIRNNN